jgi:hypothetical protein
MLAAVYLHLSMVVGVVGEISPRAQELVEEECDIELVYVTIQGKTCSNY